MSIVRHDPAAHRFELEIDGRFAVAEYRLEGRRMILTHTWAPPELRGRGLAGQVVTAALDHARAAGLRVVPQCGYVDTFLRRHPAYADLRAE